MVDELVIDDYFWILEKLDLYPYPALLEGMFELFCNFSGIYLDEEIVRAEALLDLSEVEGTECYCSDEAAMAVRSALEPYPFTGLHWIDGGDYHYVSLFWLEKIKREFVFVLFDNHPDDIDPAFGPDLLSCGSWVKNVRQLPFCRGIFHIRNINDIPVLPGDMPVYFSIDKDVLSPAYARTNWDQGNMSLDELLSSLEIISRDRIILGADICGGISLSKGASPDDISINRRTDLRLGEYLKTLLKTEMPGD